MNTTTPQPPDEKNLARAPMGIVDDLSKIFTGLRYVKNIVTPGHGSRLDKAPGEAFIWFVRAAGGGGFPESWRGGQALVATPVIRDAIPLDSLRVEAWGRTDYALVTAKANDYPSEFWVAFVPLESIRSIAATLPA